MGCAHSVPKTEVPSGVPTANVAETGTGTGPQGPVEVATKVGEVKAETGTTPATPVRVPVQVGLVATPGFAGGGAGLRPVGLAALPPNALASLTDEQRRAACTGLRRVGLAALPPGALASLTDEQRRKACEAMAARLTGWATEAAERDAYQAAEEERRTEVFNQKRAEVHRLREEAWNLRRSGVAGAVAQAEALEAQADGIVQTYGSLQ